MLLRDSCSSNRGLRGSAHVPSEQNSLFHLQCPYIALPTLSSDSTNQAVLLVAGFSLVFFLTIFGVVRQQFYLTKKC